MKTRKKLGMLKLLPGKMLYKKELVSFKGAHLE